MYVCLCKAVTDRQLDEAIERGHDSVEALQDTLGVATGCGCCRSFVEERLEGEAVSTAGDSTLFYAVS